MRHAGNSVRTDVRGNEATIKLEFTLEIFAVLKVT